MASRNTYNYFRSWMDNQHDPVTGELTEEFVEGLAQFMEFAGNQDMTLQTGNMYCPCFKCGNRRFQSVYTVRSHLIRRGFMPGYKVWYSHGENESMVDFGSISDQHYISDRLEESTGFDENVGTIQMVNDAYRENRAEFIEGENRIEEPNLETRRFFDMLDAAKNPLYKGCREGHSPLSAATRLMTIKTDFNLAEACVDAIADFVKDILPEDNLAPDSYSKN